MRGRSFSIWAVFSSPLSRYYIKNSASGAFVKPLLLSPTGTGLWNNSCVSFHMFPWKRLLSAQATLRFQCPPSNRVSLGSACGCLVRLWELFHLVLTARSLSLLETTISCHRFGYTARQADSIRYVIARYRLNVTASKYRKSKHTLRVCFLLGSSFSPHAPTRCVWACFLLFLSLGA